jgi:hypothetical protein
VPSRSGGERWATWYGTRDCVLTEKFPAEIESEVRRFHASLAEVADRLTEMSGDWSGTRFETYVGDAVFGIRTAATALYAAADMRCTLEQPPSDLDTRPRGPDKRMITQCFHDPAHCWDGTGTYVDPCP